MNPRPSSPELDKLIGERIPLLDHGFVSVVDYMGNESSVIRAARLSYGQQEREDGGEKLLRYLMRHRHTSPFEQAEIALHVKLPIFVARQWIRHRTASVNEYSARYSILDREFYIPSADALAKQSTTNKQGREPIPVTSEQAARVRELLTRHCSQGFEIYGDLIDGNGDLPELSRELARIGLSINAYTQWVWKVDLHNLMHFLSLRMDPHAQFEIRVYAEEIYKIVRSWVPNVAAAFRDYRLDAHTFSGPELKLLRLIALSARNADALACESAGYPFVLAGWRREMRSLEPNAFESDREALAFWGALGLEDEE